MTYLNLFIEFFKIGLFALGGGPATIPFLNDLTTKYDWFDKAELANFIAISESTPGPIGINMATYAGYNAGGFLGGLVATLSLVLPSIIIIILIAKFLEGFSDNKYVKGVFYGIRPAVCALIATAVLGLLQMCFITNVGETIIIRWDLIIITAVVFILLQIKKLNKLHPAVWILLGAAIGLIFKL